MKNATKLIEVALPLEAINAASVREGYIYRGNPSALHKWWAQRPLAAARAVIFAQMVDDPSAHPDLFPTETAQAKERARLFRIIEELIKWENTTNEEVLQKAREEICQSWRRACAENADHPRAAELFDRHRLPVFHDPFAGGGTLPLEAQRLNLEAYAGDLNPVAVLICKAAIEIPQRFARRPPINPDFRKDQGLFQKTWVGADGLAEDVRYYGQWVRDEAEKRIGHLYPRVAVTEQMASDRPDLKPLVGKTLPVIAWLWARTVKSPNPAFAKVDVPLASTFMLSTRPGKAAYVEPVVEGDGYRFTVKVGEARSPAAAKRGTKLARGPNFECLMSGTPITGDYIKAEGRAARMGARMMAVVAESERGRLYLTPTPEMERVALDVKSTWKPEVMIAGSTQYLGVKPYGMERFDQIFTARQLVALATFSDLIVEARQRILQDALASGLKDDDRSLDVGGAEATAYSQGVSTYLAFSLSKASDYNCSLVPWYTKEDRPGHLFSKQAIPMVWDYTELNILSDVGGSWKASFGIVAGAVAGCPTEGPPGRAAQCDAVVTSPKAGAVISTDPPYYDNVPYADLSDFFYVWLRRSLKPVFPELFGTVATPKAEELVAFAYRHQGKAGAESFFLRGMTQAMHRLAEQAHPEFPVTIYYAFRQAEGDDSQGIASTGWETFLDAVMRAGFAIGGTWPMRTERGERSRGIGSNALASSIVLVCRPRPADARTATRRDFVSALNAELPRALIHLQRSNIAPVDLAQAAIGPGMAVYSRHAQVLDAAGAPMTVREALALINQTLDEALTEQEGDFDADSRWALQWFEQFGFGEGQYGIAETLSKAKNTSVGGLVQAGIVLSKAGRVRLLKPTDLPPSWSPASDSRPTAWEMVHHLVRLLDQGEGPAAALVTKLGVDAEVARELTYRLYALCVRKKRPQEALAYNALVQSWPEITRLAREGGAGSVSQASLLDRAGE